MRKSNRRFVKASESTSLFEKNQNADYGSNEERPARRSTNQELQPARPDPSLANINKPLPKIKENVETKVMEKIPGGSVLPLNNDSSAKNLGLEPKIPETKEEKKSKEPLHPTDSAQEPQKILVKPTAGEADVSEKKTDGNLASHEPNSLGIEQVRKILPDLKQDNPMGNTPGNINIDQLINIVERNQQDHFNEAESNLLMLKNSQELAVAEKAHYFLGKLYFQQQKNAKAIDTFLAFFSSYPKSIYAYNALIFCANLFIKENDCTEALLIVGFLAENCKEKVVLKKLLVICDELVSKKPKDLEKEIEAVKKIIQGKI